MIHMLSSHPFLDLLFIDLYFHCKGKINSPLHVLFIVAQLSYHLFTDDINIYGSPNKDSFFTANQIILHRTRLV